MTETAIAPIAPPRQAVPGAPPRIHPSDILVHLIVTLLVPMFLEAAGGELHFARMAALETVTSYRARTHADLIAIAQIVAFGFAALASLSQSLVDDVSVAMALRLRGNANGLSRSAEQNRRALAKSQADRTMPNTLAMADLPAQAAAADEIDPAYEAAVIASVAEAQRLVAEAQARLWAPEPAPAAAPVATPTQFPSSAQTDTQAETPAPAQTDAPIRAAASVATPILAPALAQTQVPAQPSVPAPALAQTPRAAAVPAAGATLTKRQMQAMWAAAMTHVADEFTASVPHLPPAERKLASRRAIALSTCATDLIAGTVPPPPRPGDFGWFMQSNTR
jgi:hypothetical protein